MGRPKSATRLTKAEINRRYRNRLRGGPPRQTSLFWERVEKTDGCWLWTGHRNAQGYGTLWFHGNSWRAHRLAWHLTNSGVPEGLDVLHHCDNPPCVRPDHLFLGTDRDNVDDRERKGRNVPRKKLTDEQVADIRRRYRPGRGPGYSAGMSQILAKEFGVHRSYIRQLVIGKHRPCA